MLISTNQPTADARLSAAADSATEALLSGHQMQMNQLHSMPMTSMNGGLSSHFAANSNQPVIGGTLHRGSLSQHNTLSRRTGNGMLTGANGAGGLMISNYATISRAAHGQLLNGGHLLANGHSTTTRGTTSAGGPTSMLANGTLLQSMLGAMSHGSLANGGALIGHHHHQPSRHLHSSSIHHPLQGMGTHSLYASSPYLQQQQQPQFVGLEAHLELVEQPSCCCCFNSGWRNRCNLSRVIAFVCGIAVIILMTLCIASSNWLTADKYRQGLWEFCVDDGAALPLPFDINVEPGCYPGRDVAYVRLAGILCSFGLVFDFFATVMTGFGLCSNNPHRKYTLYRFALYVMIASLIVILTALVIYPAYFASEIEISNRQVWEFGWAYGVGWGASIFLFGAVLLLLCDKETEEIYYKERTIVHNPHNGALKA